MTETDSLKGIMMPDDMLQAALRFSLDAEYVAERCNRRACRKVGLCRLTVVPGRTTQCGGGITDSALERAAHLALFGWLICPNEEEALRRIEARAARALAARE